MATHSIKDEEDPRTFVNNNLNYAMEKLQNDVQYKLIREKLLAFQSKLQDSQDSKTLLKLFQEGIHSLAEYDSKVSSNPASYGSSKKPSLHSHTLFSHSEANSCLMGFVRQLHEAITVLENQTSVVERKSFGAKNS